MLTAKEKVIVALDGMSRGQALDLAARLQGSVWGFKVNDLLLEAGIEIIRELKNYGGVFADAKLYDIPNTVGNCIAKLDAAGADLITIHASGGARMIGAAASRAATAKILAVTALTAFSEQEFNAVYRQELSGFVRAAASLAAESGAHGVVCSPDELQILADLPLQKVTPGVRPAWHQAADDQRRVATPAAALQQGAAMLVIGRPITAHDAPERAVEDINAELASIG